MNDKLDTIINKLEAEIEILIDSGVTSEPEPQNLYTVSNALLTLERVRQERRPTLNTHTVTGARLSVVNE